MDRSLFDAITLTGVFVVRESGLSPDSSHSLQQSQVQPGRKSLTAGVADESGSLDPPLFVSGPVRGGSEESRPNARHDFFFGGAALVGAAFASFFGAAALAFFLSLP